MLVDLKLENALEAVTHCLLIVGIARVDMKHGRVHTFPIIHAHALDLLIVATKDVLMKANFLF